ncbi:CBO0543 family protein [Pseudalkalibacillus hwajinpoensis]|nr:CBO0543 family protein [Pseudalkalibacillus hwajinpoensis]
MKLLNPIEVNPMYLLFVMVVWIFFAYKFIDWSQWRKQYPTILFFIAANLTYNFLYFNHTLWAFRGVTAEWINHSIINMAFTFFICPVGLIIYLQRFPKKRINQITYIAIWAGFYTLLETLFAYKGLYVYDNGWNGWLNIPLNTILFVMIYIHYRSPVKALIISIPIAILFYLFFPVPLESLK